VFFESPRRTHVTLVELAKAFGPSRRAVACRELTKTHEEIRRGTLGELAAWAEGGVLGEVTLVIEGVGRSAPASGPLRTPEEAAAEVAARVAAGADRKDARVAVARESGLSRQAVYDAVARGKEFEGSPGST